MPTDAAFKTRDIDIGAEQDARLIEPNLPSNTPIQEASRDSFMEGLDVLVRQYRRGNGAAVHWRHGWMDIHGYSMARSL